MENILIVRDGLSNGNGGAITALLSLANNIKDVYHVKFIFLYEDTVDKEALKEFEFECIHPTFEIPRIQRKLMLYTSTLWKLNKILKREKPDCVISFGSTSLTLVTMLKKSRGYKLIVSERSDPNYCARTTSDRIRYYCYNYADKMVFQIPGVRDYFNQKVRRRSVIIPNPVGIPDQEWKIDGTCDIACVARMEMRQKRQDLLLMAFVHVLKSFPLIKLHLYGDGADMEKTKDIAKSLGIENSVVFHGVVKGVKQIIINHRLFVLTSDYEGIPNSLLEAMSLGMPVVATECSPGGAAFLIKNGENGLLVPRGDVDEIAQAMIKALSDDELSVRLGRNARESSKGHSYERNRESWINTIESVING